jgi:hypothetical protein
VTHTARARLHKHELVLSDPSPLAQGFPGGDRDQRRGRGLGERERLRLAGYEALVDDLELLVSAGRGAEAAVAEVDLVAGPHARNLGTDALDDPGAVPAEHGRE